MSLNRIMRLTLRRYHWNDRFAYPPNDLEFLSVLLFPVFAVSAVAFVGGRVADYYYTPVCNTGIPCQHKQCIKRHITFIWND